MSEATPPGTARKKSLWRTVKAVAWSFVGLRALAMNGMGATLLPLFMAHAEPGLTLLGRAPRKASNDIWVLTHANLRQSGRVHAFMEHVAQEVRALRRHLESSDAPPE